MPPRSKILTLGPFKKGMVTARHAGLLAPDEAVYAKNVDLTDGSLKGLYGPTVSSGSVAANSQFIHQRDGGAWLADTVRRYALDDAIFPGTGKRLTYYTFPNGQARYLNGVALDEPLGRDGPAAAPAMNANGTGTAAYYRYTFFNSTANANYPSYETNPSPTLTSVTGSTNAVVQVTGAIAASVMDKVRIYKTYSGTAGPFYLAAEITNPGVGVTATWTDTGPAQGTVLNWDVNGNQGNTLYPYDHSKAPNLTVLSNAMHSSVAGSTATAASATSVYSSGSLIGAMGSTVYISRGGSPWYFPASHTFLCDSPVTGIISNQSTTYVFTQFSVYVITGFDATGSITDFTIVRSDSPIGAYNNSCCLTPHGVAFACEYGLGLFDGNTSKMISYDYLDPYYFAANTLFYAVYDDNYLFILNNNDITNNLIVDFTNYPDLRFIQTDISTLAITWSQFGNAGLYLADKVSGTVYWWKPLYRGLVGLPPTQMAWEWKTGKLSLGDSNGQSRFDRLWIKGTGNFTVTATCGNFQNTVIDTQVFTGSDWFKPTFVGDWVQLDITSTGSGVIEELELEGELYNAA